MRASVFETLSAQSLLAGVLWTLECGLSKSSFVKCSIRNRSLNECPLAWQGAVTLQEPSELGSSCEDGQILAIEASFLAKQIASGAADLRALQRQRDKPHHAIVLNLDVAAEKSDSDLESVEESFSRLCAEIGTAAHDGQFGSWKSVVASNNYRIQTALPRDIYPDLFNIPSAFPCASSKTSPCAALVLSSATPNAVATAAALARALKEEGLRTDLVTFDRALALPPGQEKCFSNILVVPLPKMLSGAKTRPYQGTPISCFEPRYVNDAVSTLVGYHLAISVDGGITHTVMGALRRLKVETLALVGYAEGDQKESDLVNACAAFEQAYGHIVIPNIETLSRCRAFGIPHTKIRFWADQVDPALEEFGIEPLFSQPEAMQTEVAAR